MFKTIRSRAPLRLGLAGGGTDVSPYTEMYGGMVLNVTISLYATVSIEPNFNDKIVLKSIDLDKESEHDLCKRIEPSGNLSLLKGVYNRIAKEYSKDIGPFRLTTHVDAPPGSGLGSSSTLVVAIIGAFAEWLQFPLGEYDIAKLAYEIERVDLGMAGGKQDQYAATFGGFNFMEFYKEDKVIINPLRIKPEYVNELEHNFVIFNTGQSRYSSDIIEDQSKGVAKKLSNSIEAMNGLKLQAQLMKESILTGNLSQIGGIMDKGWQHKKATSHTVSNELIEEIYKTAISAGATGGKVSGAGGGGFIMFYCPNNTKYNVEKNLKDNFEGECGRFNFTKKGLEVWQI